MDMDTKRVVVLVFVRIGITREMAFAFINGDPAEM